MALEGDARLLWATYDEARTGEILTSACREIGLGAQLCTPKEVLDVVRPAKFDLVGIELGAEPRDGIAIIRQLHDRFPRLTIVAGIVESNVSTMRAALEAGASDVYRLILERVEKPLLEAVLAHTDGNQIRAAAILGINRNTLRKKIVELAIPLPGRH